MFHLGNGIEDGGTEAAILDKVTQLSSKPARWLVAVTHWQDGAWAKHYSSKSFGKIIHNADVLQEYIDREKNAASRKQTS